MAMLTTLGRPKRKHRLQIRERKMVGDYFMRNSWYFYCCYSPFVLYLGGGVSWSIVFHEAERLNLCIFIAPLTPPLPFSCALCLPPDLWMAPQSAISSCRTVSPVRFFTPVVSRIACPLAVPRETAVSRSGIGSLYEIENDFCAVRSHRLFDKCNLHKLVHWCCFRCAYLANIGLWMRTKWLNWNPR